MTSSLSSFAYQKNVNISKTKKDIPKRKMPFFFTLKILSNKQQRFLLYRHFKTEEDFEGLQKSNLHVELTGVKFDPFPLASPGRGGGGGAFVLLEVILPNLLLIK